MTRDPASAPPRPDLAFLRHRSRRVTPSAAPSPLGEFVSGHAHHESAAPTAPAAAPAAATPAPQAPSAPPVTRPSSSSLDLDERPAAPAAQPAAPSRPAPAPSAPARRPKLPRVATSGRVVLDGTGPSVTLTRVQSGIGSLWIEAACSAAVGDLRLGCAYRLRTGSSSIVSTVGTRTAPPDSRQPVLVASHERFDRVGVDLRQVREIERLMIYGFSESGTDLDWGGTVVVSTHAGARIEAPLLGLDHGSVAVFLSIYQVDGEVAIWSEMLAGRSVRDACRAFGFDDITWVDDRTPIT